MSTLEQLQEEHPGASIVLVDSDESGPYKVYEVIIRKKVFGFNENYPQDNACRCGHAYYRHFDPYENWDAVGCKYCSCMSFEFEDYTQRVSPFERMKLYDKWSVELDHYIVQWELYGHAFYPTLAQYLGATLQDWLRAIEPPKSFERSSDYDVFVEV